jgi:ferredoxin-NADP reductase/DMSO/TMAO reductase YedYZ heme-binding membrane subunit
MTTIAPTHRVAPTRTVGATVLRPRLVLALIIGGAVATLGLWWSNTPSVGGAADWVTGAGRLFGLLAGYDAPLLVLLMARLPVLDRSLGTDRLARWHALGGRYLVGLVVAHLVLIIWGYALSDGSSLLKETLNVVLHEPDLIKATIGTLMFFGIGFVSARAVRRRVRYETWYHLHLATYVAVFLVFFHELSDGNEFGGNSTARTAWYGLYLGSAALLVVFRVCVPIYRARRYRLRVSEVRQEAPGVVSVLITGERLGELARRTDAGQFFRWRFLTPGLAWSANPYSLSAPPNRRFLRITVKELGGHSGALARLRPGTRVIAEGPYGGFTAARRRGRKVLLIAAGVGITPIRSLFETLPARPGELVLLYRASNPQELIFRQELEEIANRRGARLHYLIGSRDADPLRPDALLAALPDLPEHDVYLCGPDGMVDAARAALTEAGVERGRIHHESFAF